MVHRKPSDVEAAVSLAYTLRGLLIFCALPRVVGLTPLYLIGLRKVLTRKILLYMTKYSVYRQFCGGEDEVQLKRTIDELAGRGVHGVLDYALEGHDFDTREVVAGLLHSQEADPQARNSFEECLHMTERSLEVADMVSAVPLVATKITGLGSCYVLQGLSAAARAADWIAVAAHGYRDLEAPALPLSRCLMPFSPQDVESISDSPVLTTEEWAEAVAELGGTMSVRSIQRWILFSLCGNAESHPVVRLLQWAASKEGPHAAKLVSLLGTSNVRADADALMLRFGGICNKLEVLSQKRAKLREPQPFLLVDAETWATQRVIDVIVREAALVLNREEGPLIANTYQNYLKDAEERLWLDIAIMLKENVKIGVKMVRGAYIEHESIQAEWDGRPCPTNLTKADTDELYNRGVVSLCQMVEKKGGRLFFGTHNKQSIGIISEEVTKRDNMRGNVFVAQLLGMANALTSKMAQTDAILACKYIPWGRVEISINYLLRRVRENSSTEMIKSERRNALRDVGTAMRFSLKRVRCSFGAALLS